MGLVSTWGMTPEEARVARLKYHSNVYLATGIITIVGAIAVISGLSTIILSLARFRMAQKVVIALYVSALVGFPSGFYAKGQIQKFMDCRKQI